jgi:hypothetical protein
MGGVSAEPRHDARSVDAIPVVGTRGKQGEIKMERRKFLIGAGSAAIGSSALIGSGAFSAVTAERSVTVTAAADNNAYLGLEGDGEYATGGSSGELSLSFQTNSQGGDGLNVGDTEFTDVFTITNQGTRNVFVTVDSRTVTNNADATLTHYTGHDDPNSGMGGDTQSPPGGGSFDNQQGVILEPGAQVGVSYLFKGVSTSDISGTFGGESVVIAFSEDSDQYNSNGAYPTNLEESDSRYISASE